MSIIKANKIQNLAGFTLQNVVQVVSYEYPSTFQTYSTTWVNAFSVNITPRFQSSKFWVFASVARGADAWAAGFHWTGLAREVSGVMTGLTETRGHNYAGSATDTISNPYFVPIQFLDTPNTTSQITYWVRVAAARSSYQTNINTTPGNPSTRYSYSHITVMEVSQ